MREFRARHAEFVAAGAAVAGVSLDSVESNRAAAERLRLPYPLLTDTERRTGEAFRVLSRIGLGGWNVEFFRRTTVLADAAGTIAAVWGKVKVRGHALEVLQMTHRLAALGGA